MWEFLLPVKKKLDCEQSLIFLCKVTARETHYASGEAVSRDKPGSKPEEKKMRDCWLLLFCLGTTRMSR